jgi:hypothetical protein
MGAIADCRFNMKVVCAIGRRRRQRPGKTDPATGSKYQGSIYRINALISLSDIVFLIGNIRENGRFWQQFRTLCFCNM